MSSHSDARHPNQELESALQRIYGLHRTEIDFRLDGGPYIDLLHKLGDPHNHLPPTIHVAGTNGKGSTIAMIRALAEANGQTVHAYTSPHLFRFNERLRISGELITDDALLAAINHINAVNDDAPITFFEFTTALAFYLFAAHPAALCLLETGMGGRLDCSNVITHPGVTVITPIGYDHMEFLGDTLTKIAGEKAGIMKAGVPCVITPQRHSEVLPVFYDRAKQVGCKIIEAKPDDNTPAPSLMGDHQRDNMAAAVAAYQTLYPDAVIPRMLDIDWAGRFQTMHHSRPLIYDGAHNEDSFLVLADTLHAAYPNRPIVLILAAQANKDVGHFLAPFGDAVIYTVDLLAGRKPQTAQDLASALNRPVAGTHTDMGRAIEAASRDHPDAVIVITGSLYAAQLIPARYWPKS